MVVRECKTPLPSNHEKSEVTPDFRPRTHPLIGLPEAIVFHAQNEFVLHLGGGFGLGDAGVPIGVGAPVLVIGARGLLKQDVTIELAQR